MLTRAQGPNLHLSELITGCARPQRSLFPQVLALAATLALAIGIGWFLLRHPSPKLAQPQLAKSSQPIAPTPLPPPTATLPRAVKSPAIARFFLTPGGVRGDGDASEINLPPDARKVRFRMDLPSNEHKTYEASLNPIEGEPFFVQKSVNAHASKNGVTLFVLVPARRLPARVSILTLKGLAKTGGAQVLSKYVIRLGRK